MSKLGDIFNPKAPPAPLPPNPIVWGAVGVAAGFLIVVLLTR
jgi:hypothetical protein